MAVSSGDEGFFSIFQKNEVIGELLSGVFEVMDEGRLHCATDGDAVMLNAYCEGFTQKF